jgi:hypothetical protein
MLQQIFFTSLSPEEYASQGENIEFPVPERCPNPECMMPIPPKKHGFYQRTCLDFTYRGRILIRRYYCPYCGKTVSYLPSFCLPYYQYSLAVIYLILVSYFCADMSYSRVLSNLKEHIPDMTFAKQHIDFYKYRFLMNLNAIQMGIRQLQPDISLPDYGLDIKKGGEKMLCIVNDGFGKIQNFSQKFFEQCKRSFLSPLHDILALREVSC